MPAWPGSAHGIYPVSYLAVFINQKLFVTTSLKSDKFKKALKHAWQVKTANVNMCFKCALFLNVKQETINILEIRPDTWNMEFIRIACFSFLFDYANRWMQ